MTSGLFSYSATLGSTVVICLAFFLCFYGPLYLTVTCSEFARGVQDYGLSWEMTSGRTVFSSWFNTGYMFTSVSRGFWVTSRRSYVKVDSDPAVRSFCPFTPALSDGEVTALVVDNSDTAGFAGYDAPRAVFRFVGRSAARCSGWFCVW